jgi:hypothetical protein
MLIAGVDFRLVWISLSVIDKCRFLASVFHTIEHSKEYPLNAIIRGLTFLFYFGAVVFLGFLLLHAVQWIVSACLDSSASRQG